jgi:hypothetical protein
VSESVCVRETRDRGRVKERNQVCAREKVCVREREREMRVGARRDMRRSISEVIGRYQNLSA